jgi:hypothetical protein
MSQQEYEQIPKQLRVRGVQVRVQQRGFRVKQLVVVTTILDEAAARREEIADLYRARWQAEVSHPHYPSSNHLYRAGRAA